MYLILWVIKNGDREEVEDQEKIVALLDSFVQEKKQLTN